MSAGRLTGLDLPDDACLIAILPRLPFFVSARDTVFEQIIGDEEYVRHKKANRLAQALGRCNRGPDDYAAYFILDGRMASDIMGEAVFFRFLPRGLQAELDYGQEFVDRNGLSEALQLTDSLLSGQAQLFRGVIQNRLAATRLAATFENAPGTSIRSFMQEIIGWNYLVASGDYVSAAKTFEGCILDATSDPIQQRTSAWYHYLAAHCYYLSYRYFEDAKYMSECTKNLEKAVELGQTAWFGGLRLAIAKILNKKEDPKLLSDVQTSDAREMVIRSWMEFFDHVSDKRHNPEKSWAEIRSRNLTGTHGQVCETLTTVFRLIGLEAHRVDKKEGHPDLLAFGTIGKRFLVVIDVKTNEQPGAQVSTDDVNAAIGYVPTYRRQYPLQEIIPLLFTNKEGFSQTAVNKAANAVKLMRAKEFDIFLKRLFDLMSGFRGITDIYQKASLMAKIPTPPSLYNLFDTTETQLTLEVIDKVIKI